MSGHCVVDLGLRQGVLLAGGRSQSGGPGLTKVVIFHPEREFIPFENLPDMKIGKKLPSCATLDRKVYVGGEQTSDMAVFDLTTKSWVAEQAIPRFPYQPQRLLTMFTMQHKVYFIGEDKEKQMFRLARDSWVSLGIRSFPSDTLSPIVLYKEILTCV